MERAKPALPLLEEFKDLFLEDLVWAHAVSLHQRLDTLQFEFAAPLVSLLKRGLQDKEQVERINPEAEFVVRYATMIGGRNLELARVCLSNVRPLFTRFVGQRLILLLVGLGECLERGPGVEGGIFGFCANVRTNRKPWIEYLKSEVHHFKVIDPLFTAGSGSEEDPFVIDDEVPQRSPCSSCAKESYAGPMRTGQCCLPRGRGLGSLLSEDSNMPQRRFEIQRRQATPSKGSSMCGTSYCNFNRSRAARK